jgi:TBC1 domain family member 2
LKSYSFGSCLKALLFQSLLLLLQNLPTADWSNSEVSVVVAEAYRLKYMFAGAPNHLQNSLKPTS